MKYFTILFLLWSRMTMSSTNEYTIGFIPKTIPRDSTKIDLYLEHIIVGQILDTIIKIDSNGELAPNLASSWKIENDGTIFTFTIREDIHFSDGALLQCEDIKYTIERHKKSKESQSSNYLQNILSINCAEKNTITFKLKSPQVSFLKILTRDHLGILPRGWEFKENAIEPWIGTGPYRLIRDNKSQLYLTKNSLFRNHNKIKIDKWKLLINENISNQKLIVPDLLLHTPREKFDEYIKNNSSFKDLNLLKPMHFIQTSIWWHPAGKNYEDNNLKQTVMGLFNDFVIDLNKRNKDVELSTGIVPIGIQGHIPKRLHINYNKVRYKEHKEIIVAVYPNEYNLLTHDNEINNQAKSLGLNLNYVKVNLEDPSFIKKLNPDVVIATYAGGFNDPDGFLIVLGNILEIDPYKYLGNLEQDYKEASKDHDWTRRGAIFKKINEGLIRNQLLVPGWKKNIVIGKSSRLIENDAFYEYSLQLEEIAPQGETK